MAGLKPIMHGFGDPFEIPRICMRCKYYEKNGLSYPTCSKREDGKLIPRPGNTCYEFRKTESVNTPKSEKKEEDES